MNSNNIDVYYPDIYCPAEEYEGVKYPGAALGEYMISLNGCKDGYGASMRRCNLNGWEEPKYFCSSSYSNFRGLMREIGNIILDDKHEDKTLKFIYNSNYGPALQTTVYNNIINRNGEALLTAYDKSIRESSSDIIFNPNKFCNVKYQDYDLYLPTHTDRIYTIKDSNDKYVYLICKENCSSTESGFTCGEDPAILITKKTTSSNVVSSTNCNLSSDWEAITPNFYRRSCSGGIQYSYCKNGVIENINDIHCESEANYSDNSASGSGSTDSTNNVATDNTDGTTGTTSKTDDGTTSTTGTTGTTGKTDGDVEKNEEEKKDNGSMWIWIILIIIIAIVIVIVIIFVVVMINKKRKNNGNTINNESE